MKKRRTKIFSGLIQSVKQDLDLWLESNPDISHFSHSHTITENGFAFVTVVVLYFDK